MITVKVHYSKELIRRVVRRFWWGRTGWVFFAASLFLLGSFVYLMASGDRSWWVGFQGTILALVVAFSVTIYVIQYRGALARLRRMRTPEATIELGEDRFRLNSDVGMSEMAWSAVTEVWSFPDFILVFVSRAQFITVPTGEPDAAARDFILAKAKALGKRIKHRGGTVKEKK